MGALRDDLWYAVRLLRRRRLFVAVAVLSLGIGLALNVTTFAVADAVLRPYTPVPDEVVRAAAEPEEWGVTLVAPDVFDVVGVRPVLGRTFERGADAARHAHPVRRGRLAVAPRGAAALGSRRERADGSEREGRERRCLVVILTAAKDLASRCGAPAGRVMPAGRSTRGE